MGKGLKALGTAAVIAGTCLGTTGSASACTVPKGWYTANAIFQYQTDLFTGEFMAGNGNPQRALTYAGAVASYAAQMASATLADPPKC